MEHWASFNLSYRALTESERETVLDRGLTWYCQWALAWFVAEQENWVDIVKDLTQVSRPHNGKAL